MLRKMIKFDLKYAARSLLTIFIIFIGISIMMLTSSLVESRLDVDLVLAILTIPLTIAMLVMYIVTTVQLFYKSLFSKEGYLIQTLPIKPTSLLASKILTALIWGVACTIICMIYSFAAMAANIPLNDVFMAFSEIFSEFTPSIWMTLIFASIAYPLNSLCHILFCCCIPAIPALKDRNIGIPIGLISYFVLSYIESLVSSLSNVDLLESFFGASYEFTQSAPDLLFILNINSLFAIVFAALYFAGASYIVSNRKSL